MKGWNKQGIEEPIDRLQTVLKSEKPIDRLQTVLKVRGRSKQPGHWISLYKIPVNSGFKTEHLEGDS